MLLVLIIRRNELPNKGQVEYNPLIFTSMLSSPSLVTDQPWVIPLNRAAADEPAGGGSGCMFVTSGTSKFMLSTSKSNEYMNVGHLNTPLEF